MNEKPVLIQLDLLRPHPQNPRLVPREAVIAAIAQHIRTSGCFDASHAILVRPFNGHYQIVSGHNRRDAADRAGLKEIPAWVREMTDEEAFMQLALSNTQSELRPLELGRHASNSGLSIREYAAKASCSKSEVERNCAAFAVYTKLSPNGDSLIDSTRQLAEIHAAPESCWPALVGRLLAEDWTIAQTTAATKTVNAVKPPRGYEAFFVVEKLREMTAAGQKIDQITGELIRNIERCRADLRNGFDPDKYLDLFEAWLTKYGPWDKVAVFTAKEGFATAQTEEQEEAEHKAAKLKRAVTLTEWKTLSPAEQGVLLHVRDAGATLNKQDGDSIEWARWSWNPVTGCWHKCTYCYARDIAERFYTQKFEPSLVPEALAAPLNVVPPKEAANDISYKNIFCCSMADLFGNWVPKEWIEAVLDVVCEAKQWNFLMLTKFPKRLKEFKFPDNCWIGTTVDLQARVANAERAMREVEAKYKWLSIEPLIEPISFDFSIVNWVVIGGASESSQTPEWRPPRKWVYELTARAIDAGCVVYHKTNLNLDRMRNFPGFFDHEPERAPEPFRYLKTLAPAELITLGLDSQPAKTEANGLAADQPASTSDLQLDLPGWVPPITTASILPDILEDQHLRPNRSRKP